MDSRLDPIPVEQAPLDESPRADRAVSSSTPIERQLETLREPERSSLLRRLLSDEITARREAGDTPKIEDYSARFPDDPHVLAEIFAAGRESHSVAANSTLSFQPDPQHSGSLDFAGPDAGTAGDELPSELGRYQLDALVGQGGFGQVWRATDPRLQRTVAIKLPRAGRPLADAAVAQFLNEARKAAALKHPGIVPVYDVGTIDGRPFIISEFIDGETLSRRIDREPVTPREAAHLLGEIARTLHHAHLHGLVHRDVKPANILLDRNGRAYVADFGLAVSEEEQRREPASVLGTRGYMSPEQMRGESHRVDPRSDIYSLGVILYELLAGRRPFLTTSIESHVDQLLHRDPRPPRTVNDRIPRELERICLKCLQRRSADRYSTAADLADELQQWLESDAGTRRLVKRHAAKVLAPVALLAVVLCLALGIVRFGGTRTPSVSGTELAAVGLGEPVQEEVASVPDSLTTRATGDPLSWRNRFGPAPRELVWPGYHGTASLEFNDQIRAFQITSDRVRFAELGKLPKAPCSISLGIKQPVWIGAAGVFMGYRTAIHEGRPCVKFHLVSLAKATTPEGKIVLQVRRSIAIVNPMNGMIEPQYRAALQVVPWPAPGENPRLELQFDRVGENMALAAARWGNVKLTSLVGKKIESHFGPEDYEGAWGVMSQYGTTWFSEPILIP